MTGSPQTRADYSSGSYQDRLNPMTRLLLILLSLPVLTPCYAQPQKSTKTEVSAPSSTKNVRRKSRRRKSRSHSTYKAWEFSVQELELTYTSEDDENETYISLEAYKGLSKRFQLGFGIGATLSDTDISTFFIGTRYNFYVDRALDKNSAYIGAEYIQTSSDSADQSDLKVELGYRFRIIRNLSYIPTISHQTNLSTDPERDIEDIKADFEQALAVLS